MDKAVFAGIPCKRQELIKEYAIELSGHIPVNATCYGQENEKGH